MPKDGASPTKREAIPSRQPSFWRRPTASPGPCSTIASPGLRASSRISVRRKRRAPSCRRRPRPSLRDRRGFPPKLWPRPSTPSSGVKRSGLTDGFGRCFVGVPELQAPLHAVRVTGALFHTQGGLVVDRSARVLRRDGRPLPNLFAAGGAACGVSGATAAGYLSGNGLLTAITLGRLSGAAAARLAGGRAHGSA